MSFNDNELQDQWDAYTAGVIDVSLVRQLLRILRKRRFSSNRTAAERAGLDPSTVAKLENLKSWPAYDPGIGVILKMLNALDIPLAVFVASLQEIDDKAVARQTNADYASSTISDTTVRVLPEDAITFTPGPDDGGAPLSASVVGRRFVARLLIEAGTKLLEPPDARTRSQTHPPDRPLPAPREQKSSGGTRRTGHR